MTKRIATQKNLQKESDQYLQRMQPKNQSKMLAKLKNIAKSIRMQRKQRKTSIKLKINQNQNPVGRRNQKMMMTILIKIQIMKVLKGKVMEFQ